MLNGIDKLAGSFSEILGREVTHERIVDEVVLNEFYDCDTYLLGRKCGRQLKLEKFRHPLRMPVDVDRIGITRAGDRGPGSGCRPDRLLKRSSGLAVHVRLESVGSLMPCRLAVV